MTDDRFAALRTLAEILYSSNPGTAMTSDDRFAALRALVAECIESGEAIYLTAEQASTLLDTADGNNWKVAARSWELRAERAEAERDRLTAALKSTKDAIELVKIAYLTGMPEYGDEDIRELLDDAIKAAIDGMESKELTWIDPAPLQSWKT